MASIRFLSFLSFLALVGLSYGQTIAAWHNTYGAQVIIQNSTTGDVYYSNCNSNGPPVFPTDPPNVFSFSKKPKVGSAFAGTGYSASGTVYAQIWYQDDDNKIWQVLAQCSTDDEKFTVKGTYEVSSNVTTTISGSTGLAALLLSSTSGYRVFFHNSTGHVHQLVYTGTKGWTDSVPISPDVPVGKSLSAAFYGSSNLTIVYPLNDMAVEVAEYNSDKTFHASTFPYPLSGTSTTSASTKAFSLNTTANVDDNILPNWSAASATVGVTMDETTTSRRRIFYIDSKKLLQYYSCDVAAKISCSLQNRQDTTYWPTAESASGAMGVAYVNRTSDVFYFSTSGLVMVQMVAGAWVEVRTLTGVVSSWAFGDATSSSTSSATSTPSSESTSSATSSTSPDTSSSTSTGLSPGAAAGIAVAIVMLVLAVAGGAFFVWRRKRAAKASQATSEPFLADPTNGGKHEMEATSTKDLTQSSETRLASPPPQYMHSQAAMAQEVPADPIRVSEMEGKPVARYELG